MNNKLPVAFRVWAVSVTINAVFFGICLMFIDGPLSLLSIILFLFFGFLFTAPVPFFVWLSLNITAKIPYSVNAKLICFAIFQLVIVLLFYQVALMIMEYPKMPEYDSGLKSMVGLTSLAVSVSCFLTRKSVEDVVEDPLPEILDNYPQI